MARRRRTAAEWAALIDQWRDSGLRLPAFCERRGLNRGTMQGWVYKLGRRVAIEAARQGTRAAEALDRGGPTPAAFLPVRVAEPSAGHEGSDDAGVAIVLGAGRWVVVRPGFDPDTLRRVVAALEGRPC